MKYIVLIFVLFFTSGCVQNIQGMNSIINTLASIGSRSLQYQSNGIGLNSNGNNSMTINGVNYSTGRSGIINIDDGSYGIGNGAGGWIRIPQGSITGKGISMYNNGNRIRF